MGYETALYLVNVKIKNDSIPRVKQILKKGTAKGLDNFRYFFEHVLIDSEGFLHLIDKEKTCSTYEINEEENTFPAIYGKWHESEEIASWLKLHSEKGGRIIQHSAEADGSAWGWEFDGKGRMKYFQLDHVGEWK